VPPPESPALRAEQPARLAKEKCHSAPLPPPQGRSQQMTKALVLLTWAK
jgi:hypothetical protein